MADLLALAEREDTDPEMVPSIIPVDSRISIGMVTSELVSMVSRIAAMVPAKETIPGTTMMLVEGIAESGAVPHVRISASDGDQWMRVVSTGAARVFMPGAVVVPAKKILEALRLAPGSVSKFSVIGSEARLLSGRALWTFATSLSDRLTVTPVEEEVELIDVPADVLWRALRAVSPATATSSARPAFLQAHIENGAVTTTDGARMHRYLIPGLPENLVVDIPSKMLARMIDLLGAVDGDRLVQFGANERRIHFHVDDARIIGQRILLPFPNVESIMVGAGITNSKAFTVETEEFKSAIKRVRVNSDPDHATLYLGVRALSGGGWGLAIRGRDQNGNEAQETIEAQWNDTKPREFMVNHHHLTDALNQVASDRAIVRVGDDTKTQKSPFLFSDSGFRAILSQMNVGWAR